MKTGQTVATGERRHWVDVFTPGPPVPDGDGGYTTTREAKGSWAVQIKPASQRELERVGSGTTVTGATHLVTGRFHGAVTTHAQLIFRGRIFEVVGVIVPQELGVETIALCSEIVVP